MMDIKIDFPIWIILGLLAVLLFFLAVSGVGIYYLVSRKFHHVALIVSAAVMLVLIVPKTLNPYHWSEFFTIYSGFGPLIVLVLTYLALFAVVNFIHRLFVKISS